MDQIQHIIGVGEGSKLFLIHLSLTSRQSDKANDDVNNAIANTILVFFCIVLGKFWSPYFIKFKATVSHSLLTIMSDSKNIQIS